MDSHLGLPRVTADLEELQADFTPFKALNHLSMAMSAHIVIDAIEPEVPATHSDKAIALIREEIGFGGLLMTDDISMEALSGTVVERAQRAIAAGCDLVLHCNGDMAEMDAIATLGALGEAAQTRADAASCARPDHHPIDICELDAEFRSLTE